MPAAELTVPAAELTVPAAELMVCFFLSDGSKEFV